jgi:transcription antitermination factor NusG
MIILAKTKPSDFIIVWTSWDPIDKIKQLKEKTMEFKVGDNILVTKDLVSVFCPVYPLSGKIVAAFDWNGTTAYHITLGKLDRKHFVYAYQLELVKEESSPKFKIGDKIKVVKATHCFHERIGQLGTIVDVSVSILATPYLIKLDNAQLWFCEEDIEKLEEPELKPGDYVEILSDAMDRSKSIVAGGIKSAIGKIGKIAEICNGYFKISKLPKECYAYLGQETWAYTSDQLKKVDKPKEEWQPKFKVGDWVTICSCYPRANQLALITEIKSDQYVLKSTYSIHTIDRMAEHTLTYWQPMQELKDQNESQAKNIRIHLATVQGLESNAIRLRTIIDAKNEMLYKERAANEALKREIKEVEESALSPYIARLEKRVHDLTLENLTNKEETESLQKSHLAYVKLMKIVTDELASQIKK